MSLAEVLNTPRTQQDWSTWSLANQLAVQAIQDKIVADGGPTLTRYQLDPIDLSNPQNFLEWNEQSHIDFNSVLGLPGVDLQDVDFRDEGQKQAWVYLNHQELYFACQKLGIGP